MAHNGWSGVNPLSDNRVAGITADRARLERGVRNSVAIVTALTPALGYRTSAEIAKESFATGVPVWEIVVGRGLLSREHADALLSPTALVRPNGPWPPDLPGDAETVQCAARESGGVSLPAVT
ncbi:hypothetical protein [Streptomyces sp. NPDC093260]|uniref:hypothetical protein n=1 Tax=Streptomyces sp. NPDC093260 TaxID=3155073 RepID=UPI003422A8FB